MNRRGSPRRADSRMTRALRLLVDQGPMDKRQFHRLLAKVCDTKEQMKSLSSDLAYRGWISWAVTTTAAASAALAEVPGASDVTEIGPELLDQAQPTQGATVFSWRP